MTQTKHDFTAKAKTSIVYLAFESLKVNKHLLSRKIIHKPLKREKSKPMEVQSHKLKKHFINHSETEFLNKRKSKKAQIRKYTIPFFYKSQN